MKLDLITFDLDDTLYEHREVSERCLGAAWQVVTAEFPAVSIHDLSKLHAAIAHQPCGARMRFEAILTRAGIHRLELAALMDKAFNTCRLASLKADADAASTLHVIRASGIKIGAITNGRFDVQQMKLVRTGLVTWFDFVLAEVGEHAKPAVTMFEIAARIAGTTSDRSLHVGNSWEHDVQGALSAGFHSVYFARGFNGHASDPRVSSICRLADLNNLLDREFR